MTDFFIAAGIWFLTGAVVILVALFVRDKKVD